jgi:hypothetical protein
MANGNPRVDSFFSMRRLKGLSIMDASKRLGISPETLTQGENGTVPFSDEEWATIQHALSTCTHGGKNHVKRCKPETIAERRAAHAAKRGEVGPAPRGVDRFDVLKKILKTNPALPLEGAMALAEELSRGLA